MLGRQVRACEARQSRWSYLYIVVGMRGAAPLAITCPAVGPVCDAAAPVGGASYGHHSQFTVIYSALLTPFRMCVGMVWAKCVVMLILYASLAALCCVAVPVNFLQFLSVLMHFLKCYMKRS